MRQIELSWRWGGPMRLDMLTIPPPATNAQRQRDFLERHPGYYARCRARRKAEEQALAVKLAAAAQLPAPNREPLLLPAPVETIEIPGMTTIGAIPAREPVTLQVVAVNPLESKGRSEIRGR